MKVRDAIKKLLLCDPDLELAYEHCYVDYIEQHDKEKIVEMGDTRFFGYSRWTPLSTREPFAYEYPCVIALKDGDGEWSYRLMNTEHDFFMGLGTAAKRGALFMPVQRTHEDKLKRMKFSDEEIQKILKLYE